jgi:hypothetical protein
MPKAAQTSPARNRGCDKVPPHRMPAVLKLKMEGVTAEVRSVAKNAPTTRRGKRLSSQRMNLPGMYLSAGPKHDLTPFLT